MKVAGVPAFQPTLVTRVTRLRARPTMTVAVVMALAAVMMDHLRETVDEAMSVALEPADYGLSDGRRVGWQTTRVATGARVSAGISTSVPAGVPTGTRVSTAVPARVPTGTRVPTAVPAGVSTRPRVRRQKLHALRFIPGDDHARVPIVERLRPSRPEHQSSDQRGQPVQLLDHKTLLGDPGPNSNRRRRRRAFVRNVLSMPRSFL